MSHKTFAWFVLAGQGAILCIAALLSSCAVPPTNNMESVIVISQGVLDGAPITRIIDDEADVICYLYREANTGRGGLSCLPLSETSLPHGD